LITLAQPSVRNTFWWTFLPKPAH